MKKLLMPMLLLAVVAASAETPERIVSTSGNASEVIHRFGLTDHLVAVDTTSVLPPDVMAKKPKIGYRRQLSAEGILSMTPDLVILAPDAGPPAVVKQLESSGVPLFYLKDEKTLDGINEDITSLGEVLGVPEQAAALVAEQQTQAEALVQSKTQYTRTPKLVMLLDAGGGQVFGLGGGSAGAQMVDILGGESSLAFDGMKPISEEVLAADQADAVLIAARDDAESTTIIQPLAKGKYEALDMHPAMARNCVYQVNIMRALGFGPDTAAVAKEIADTIKPCVK